MAIYDLTVDNVIDIISTFIDPIAGTCQQAQVNRTAMPVGEFCILTPMRYIRHSTTTETNADTGSSSTSAMTYGEVRQLDLQVDIYGDNAGDRAVALETVFRTNYAYDTITGTDSRVAPLYSSDAIQAPMVNAEDQWQDRYIITLSLQVHVTITLQQDYFDQAEISTQQVK
ncbi:MAG: hypothetical protein [Caudoviricetes sp.]|nr:MAG: hypothetical protein [Caudoviricetes sp.]